jgi:hypothetical protein
VCVCESIYIYIERVYILLGVVSAKRLVDVGAAQHLYRQHTSAYVSIRQHTSAYVSIGQHMSAQVSIGQHMSAQVSIGQHRSA